MRPPQHRQEQDTIDTTPPLRNDARHYRIVRTYADEGKSGLRIDGREALQQLIDDVEGRPAPTSRPSSSTTSAAGAGSRTPTRAPTTSTSASAPASRCTTAPSSSRTTAARPSTIVKSVKRAMAGEYSRELSAKVFTGPVPADRARIPPGRRRRLRPAPDAASTRPASRRASCSAASRRACRPTAWSWCPGPTRRSQVVRRIYRAVHRRRASESEIAADAERRGPGRPTSAGRGRAAPCTRS